MSRRARLEQDRQKLLNVELQEEENRLQAIRNRIYAPIIWRNFTEGKAAGIRIEDLKPKYYDDALKIIEECYFDEEVLCRNSNIREDPVSVKSFLEVVLFNLKDTTSIIAIDQTNEEKEEIAGFLILKTIRKNDYGNILGRVQMIDGEAFKKCMAFINYLSRKADVFTTFDCEIFLRYILICIKPEYRKKGIGYQLMLTGVDVARSLDIPVITGLFSCYSLQKLAKKIGMKVVFEMNYVDWTDRFNDMIFDDPGVGNYTCAAMAGLLPPPPKPEPPPKKEEEKVTLTREEKRKLKAKQARKLAQQH